MKSVKAGGKVSNSPCPGLRPWFRMLWIPVISPIVMLASVASAQDPPIRNTYSADSSYPRLSIERFMVYQPDTGWYYSHHPYICRFKKNFIAIWSNGMKDEDQPGQRVAIAWSPDGRRWSAPSVLAKPGRYKGDTLNVLTAAGFHIHGDTLVAYYGEYSPHRTHTRLLAKTSTDGRHWSDPIDLHVPVNPNLGPRRVNHGRLIICGNFCFPYSDDPSGIRGWNLSSFYPDSLYREDNPATFYAPAASLGLPPLCEGAFFESDDSVIHMLLRATGRGWKGILWLSESRDNGKTWSIPVKTAFTDNDSKFYFGRLPDRRIYYAGIPDTTKHYERNPLVLSTSRDGRIFDKNYIVADEPYTRRREGLWKGGQYGYPFCIVSGSFIYVIVSRQKEAIEVIRIRTGQLN